MLAFIRAFFSRTVAGKARGHAAIDEELQCHLEMEIEENLRQGMTAEEARRRALVALGGLEQTREEYREAWAVRWLSNLAQDLRYALRTYRKNPGYVAVVVLTLTLGIGANVALFTVLNTLFWAAPRVEDPARLVGIRLFKKKIYSSCSYFEYLTLKENLPQLSGLAASTFGGAASPYGTMRGQLVSSNYFEVLGAGMAVGRGFKPEDDRTPNPVVVLSYKTWERKLGSDRKIVGKTITLSGYPFTVIGVTARDFGDLSPLIGDYWAPIPMYTHLSFFGQSLDGGRYNLSFELVGRVKRGVSVEQARQAITAAGYHLSPPDGPVVGVEVQTKERLYPPPSPDETLKVYLPLEVAFGLLLLIACANVANLVLARSAARRREISVRLALGASRARLVWQLFTESAVLALVGGGLSLFLALPLVKWVFDTAAYPILGSNLGGDLGLNIRLDLNVFLYAFGVSLLAGAALGLAPALESTRFDLASSMKGNVLDVFGRMRGSGPRDRLVVMQLAACLTLLVGAGLLLRGVVYGLRFDPGFNPNNAFYLTVMSGLRGVDDSPLRAQFIERLRLDPQVTAVSAAELGGRGGIEISVPGRSEPLRSLFNTVTPDYFSVLQLPIVRGRLFTPSEVQGESPVAVITEIAANMLWPGQNALGKRLEIVRPDEPGDPRLPGVRRFQVVAPGWVEVIGITRDMRGSRPNEQRYVRPCVYLPRLPGPKLYSILVRVRDDRKNTVQALRAELSALHPGAALEATPLTDLMGPQLRTMRFLFAVAGLLGSLGLLLATIGLYGIMSYAVTQRTQEIGVRIALGARVGSVLWLILGRALRLALAGVAVGLALAALLSWRMLEPYLYKVSRYDPLTFTVVPVILVAICLFAAYVPARRATRLDPLVALHHE